MRETPGRAEGQSRRSGVAARREARPPRRVGLWAPGAVACAEKCAGGVRAVQMSLKVEESWPQVV